MHAFGGFQGEMLKTFLQYTLGKSILFASNVVKTDISNSRYLLLVDFLCGYNHRRMLDLNLSQAPLEQMCPIDVHLKEKVTPKSVFFCHHQ